MADGANIAGGIGAFLTGFAQGAAKTHIQQTLQRRQIATKQKLDDIGDAIKRGDVALIEALIKDPDVSSIYDKDTRSMLLESAKRNTPGTRLQETIKALPQILSILAGQGQLKSTGEPTEGEAPIREETITQGQRPSGMEQAQPPISRPAPTLMPTPTPAPAPTRRAVPPAPSPTEMKGLTISKEGEISFSIGLKGMNEQVLGRINQLMNTMTTEQAIRQARSENLPIDPKQEESLMQIDFAREMNKYLQDNKDRLVDTDPRTKLILAYKHATNYISPVFAPPDIRALATEKPRIKDETEETIMAERARTGVPLDAPITAKEIASAREQLRREKRGEKIFEAGPITQLKKETELGVPERPGPTERKEISERLAMFDTLSAIRLTFDPAFVGFLSGRVRGTVTKVFGTTVKEATFRTEAANIKNSTIRAITGAQVGGPQEADRIMQQIPDLNDPPSTFAGKFNSTWRNHISLQVRRAQIEEASGTFVPELVWRKIDGEIAAYEKAFGGKFNLDQRVMNAPLPTGEPPPYLRSRGIGQPLTR